MPHCKCLVYHGPTQVQNIPTIIETSTAEEWFKHFKLHFSTSRCLLVFGNSLRVKSTCYVAQKDTVISHQFAFQSDSWPPTVPLDSPVFSGVGHCTVFHLFAHTVHLGKGLLDCPLEQRCPPRHCLSSWDPRPRHHVSHGNENSRRQTL